MHFRRLFPAAVAAVIFLATGFFVFKSLQGHRWGGSSSSPEAGVNAVEDSVGEEAAAVVRAGEGSAAMAGGNSAGGGAGETAGSPAAPPASAVPALPMLAAAGGDAPRRSTREQAANGRSVAAILQGVDMSDPEARAKAVAEMKLLDERQRNAVEEKARRLGIPLRIEGPGNKLSTLYDFRGDEPLYRTTLNVNAAISTGANLLAPAPYSLDGTGIRVGVWDGGSVRSTHQEFAGRVVKRNASAPNDDHATHVAGTIGATGVQPAAKGMAPRVNIDSYDWNSDYAEMTAAGAATAGDTAKLPLSNHSYGYNAVTADMGRYETEASTTDALAASLPYYLIFWAAGNEQDTLTAKGGYQSITFNGLAKNIMTVGAVDDAVSGGIRTPSLGTIAYFSSLGPCDDGRIKPDIVANGVNVYSSVATSNTAYDGTYSGTSMATPNAMGSAVLLQQLYAREYSGQRIRASTLKGLLIHTATDIGTAGPDYKYGWGLMNVKDAADLILANKQSLGAPNLLENTITSTNTSRTHTFTWDGVSPIRATLCWTDPAGAAQTGADSRTRNTRNNLDVRVTAPNGTTVYNPYVMPFVNTWTTASMALPATTGKNNVDTVEQVYLATPTQAGVYTVTVSIDGALTGTSQAYSLVVTGGTSVASNPPPSVVMTSPSEGATFLPGAQITVAANATDVALGGGVGVVSQVEFFEGGNSLGVDTTPPYTLNWTPSAPGTYSLTARATDSEGASSSSPAVSMVVMSGNGNPNISSFTPGSGSAGALVVISGGNLTGTTSVKFNGVDSSFVVDSNGQITATVPAQATTGVITVTNAYGTSTSASVFEVAQSAVLISQIYGGGGNTGATYRQDYVELYNRGNAPVSLAGWSVQYASATGTTWAATPLSGTIAPGKYHLVGLAGGTIGLALPAPDSTGSINMSATTGKVALTNSVTLLTGSSPLDNAALQDFVGYGTANAFETAVAPAPSTTTAIFRAGSGAIDSGNNAADFSAAAPNPRNSGGTLSAPVINSAATATATVGVAFSYQITATNSPTSFNATGLPAGLSVSTSSGLISGIPTGAGSATVNLTATNSVGTGSRALTLTVSPPSGGAPVTIFSENMGSPSGSVSVGTNIFENLPALGFTGMSGITPVSVRTTEPSSGYTGASGGGNVLLDQVGGAAFEINKINTQGYSDLRLSLGHRKSTSASSNELIIEVSSNGTTYTPLTYSRPSGSGTSGWLRISPSGTIPAAANLRIRFRQPQNTVVASFRVDDVVLTGVLGAATPEIVMTGNPQVAAATYGSPSPVATTLTVSGTNLTAGVSVAPPAGFEVSLSELTAYAPTVVVPAAGILAPTPVYLRLAGGVNAGSYSGNLVCSSAGAASVTTALAPTEVRPKLLTVTANHRTKVYGSTLAFGSGQTGFTSVGLVPGQTIGTVTLTSPGGAAFADAGVYAITPSQATGGSFNPENYDILYVDGVLTVTAQTLNDWLAGYNLGALSGFSDDPDADGIPNGLENYFGTAPDAASRGLTAVSMSGSTLVFRHSRNRTLAGDVTVSYQWSVDAVNWYDSGVSVSGVSVAIAASVVSTQTTPQNDLVEVTATVTGQAPKMFVRLRAVR